MACRELVLSIMRACANSVPASFDQILERTFGVGSTLVPIPDLAMASVALDALLTVGIVATYRDNLGERRYGLSGWFVDEVRGGAFGVVPGRNA